ncbi:HEPN domain-containing protein [Leptolyngbya boryana CZ1]|uniref:HEPN domain-containing protein n=1 Tax=Leptolyngbya boryana CZ1 TaxID=3060204 RepID=A0AA96WSP5_LEPBY|nr:HEPN domain-containing protein [Leptolyngbya boryana]WNZ44758.1 HEPN domain-containing protein [Leptolyngbya boryana CZ1]
MSSAGYFKNSQLRNFNYEISASNLKVLEEIRVFELSNILKKPYEQVNEFEGLLLRGIHWFARSQTQVDVENEFLNLTTCLEVFFTSKGGDPISSSIAEGVALILGKELTERKRLKRRVKELYGFRSNISHGGHSPILAKDIVDLKSIAMSLLVKMVEWSKDFSSRKDLVDWLEDQKLS